MKRAFWVLAALLAVLAVAGCGSSETEAAVAAEEVEADEGVEQSASTTTVAVSVTSSTSTSTSSAPPPTTEVPPAEDQDILVVRSYLAAYSAGDIPAMAATIEENFANQPFLGEMTYLGWQSWWSQFKPKGQIIDCWREDEYVSCEHDLTHDMPTKVGLQNRFVDTARVENGQIVEYRESHRLESWWGGFFAWIAQNHPDEGACNGRSAFGAAGDGQDFSETWDVGRPPIEWIDECYEFMMSVVQDYAASPDYSQPADADTTG